MLPRMGHFARHAETESNCMLMYSDFVCLEQEVLIITITIIIVIMIIKMKIFIKL